MVAAWLGHINRISSVAIAVAATVVKLVTSFASSGNHFCLQLLQFVSSKFWHHKMQS